MRGNKQICNRITGQEILFKHTGNNTGGRLLEMETLYPAGSSEPPVHYHPHQSEIFEVLEGELTVRMNDNPYVYTKGQIIEILRGMPHCMWNAGTEDARISWKVTPAMNTANFLHTLFELANAGKTNASGVPALPVMIFLLKKYRNVFRLANISGTTLNILAILFCPFFFFGRYEKRFGKAIVLSMNDNL